MNQRHLRKCWTILICVPLIGLFLFGLPSAVFSQSAPAHIYIEPAASNALTCGTHQIQVMVENVVDLTAYHLEISFDPDVVEVLEVVNGEFLAEPDDVDYFYEPSNDIDNVNGLISFGMAQQGVETEPEVEPQSGSGSLIVITLQALLPNASTIFHIDAAMSNLVEWPSAFEIAFTATDGEVVTESCPPTDIALTGYTVPENEPVETGFGSFFTIDPDLPNDTFTYTLVSGAGDVNNGSFEIVGSSLKTNEEFNYEEQWIYRIRVRSTDWGGKTLEKAFWIFVLDVNDPPVADEQSVLTTQETPIDITLTGSDEDGDELTFEIVSAPARGVLTGTAPHVTYTSEEGFVGEDSFTFRVCDDEVCSAPATVKISVAESEGWNYYFPIFLH